MAGASGATGQTMLALPEAAESPLVPHLRPKTAALNAVDPRSAVFELTDRARLEETLAGCTTVVQLIGTMRRRFSTGDTYETSDIGTTRLLIDAARATKIDHVVLLSSVGAGKPTGAYLKAKAQAEQIVLDSGIAATIFRPSAFYGAGHKVPPGAKHLAHWLGLKRYEPIDIRELARTLLHVARRRVAVGEILEGENLWRWVHLANGAAAAQLP